MYKVELQIQTVDETWHKKSITAPHIAGTKQEVAERILEQMGKKVYISSDTPNGKHAIFTKHIIEMYIDITEVKDDADE